MARVAIAHVHGGFAASPIARVVLRSENARLRSELAQLREQMRIKDARMARVPAKNRPRYLPHERHAILMLRAAAGWSAAQTARAFLVSPPTIADWSKALRDESRETLVTMADPVNRFPDYVRLLVRQLKVTFPTMGRRRIADTLCRAGLHLSPSTVRRVLHRTAPPPANDQGLGTTGDSPPADASPSTTKAGRTVTARYPHHVWNLDTTLVPICEGFWVPWLTYAILERWPFCFHVAVVVDHFSRGVVYAQAFPSKPSARELRCMLDRAVHAAGQAPKYTVSDQGSQFQGEYLDWCDEHDVRPRFGAIGKKGSIALVERFIRTMKSEGLRRTLVPFTLPEMNRELSLFARWYNVHRPHRGLDGATPAEVRDERTPAQRILSYETRPAHPLRSKLTERRRIERVQRVAGLELVVGHVEGRRHLPIVELRPVA